MLRAGLALGVGGAVAATAVVAVIVSGGDSSPASAAPAPACGRLSGSTTEVYLPPVRVRLGSDAGFDDSPPRTADVAGFWMDRAEVSNAQFSAFVSATGYRTLAERAPRPEDNPGVPQDALVPGSAVFTPPEFVDDMRVETWWRYTPGADWRHPEGPGSTLKGRMDHPVVHVGYEDAAAYARWAGRFLPTEDEWERAASGALSPSDTTANTWQGAFPLFDAGGDGFKGPSPVGCFKPNPLGLHDLIGNVWEWTESDFEVGSGADVQRPRAIKGGSYLCAPNYCARYRPAARQPGDPFLGASHIGFRTIRRRTESVTTRVER